MRMFEKILGTFAAQEPNARIVCVQLAGPNQTPTLEMRHEVECGEYGWVTQKRMTFAPGQYEMLKASLSMMDPDARKATPTSLPVGHLSLVSA